jgi:signal transduction histidine kinase
MSLSIGLPIFWLGNLSFFAMVATNVNLRLGDQTMTFAMMLWGTISSFAWVYFITEDRHLVIMVYLLAMMLGTFRLRISQYLQVTVLSLTLYAAISAVSIHNDPQNTSLVSEGMNWFVFMLVMLGFSLLGGESSQLRDLLQRRNRELRDAHDVATVANQAKSRFLASTSHELRTPLNAILGATEIINPEGLPAQDADALERARRAGLYLLSLVNSMIDLSQLKSENLSLRPGPGDLFEELDIVRQITQTRAEYLGLGLRIDSDIPEPFPVEMDTMRMREVLLHLINNAINLTESGEIVVSANCTSKDDESATIEFCITDTGRGMTPTHIERLSEQSTLQRKALTHDQTRSDLELSMCQELVQLMGGDIKVLSRLGMGMGSTLSFTLTFARGETRQDKVSEHQANPSVANCRLLIVDDAVDNRMLLGFI